MNHPLPANQDNTPSANSTRNQLASALRLQRLLAEVSSHFITGTDSETSHLIESCQGKVCEALGLDRSTLWLFSDDGVEMALASYWQREDSPPLRRNFVTRGNLPWADQQIRNGRAFHFSSLSQLPAEAGRDRDILHEYGTKSNATFPLVAQGKVFGALAFAMVRKEHHWSEEELAGLQLIAQLFSHVISKNRAEERAEQLLDEIQRSSRAAVLGELAAALAHEINQPLTTILSNAQAARRFLTQGTADPREILAILDDIIRADKRATEVVRNLREMLEEKPSPREPLCLNELVSETCAACACDPSCDGIELHFEPGDPPTRLALARVEIQQVLINLITNASHALRGCPPHLRRIVIQTRSSGGSIHLHVRDHGHGIPPEHLDRIFEPFHTTRVDGLGMGLAISRRIAERHGGSLRAANHENGGAVFTLSLPIDANG